MIPAAASAINSGSNRSRLRNTSTSVSAITTSATINRTTIDREICDARSLTTTGAPVTVYRPPYAEWNIGICTAARIHLIARDSAV